MQTITVDSNDFAEIRQSRYLYVDKTSWLHRLTTAKGRKMFFLARPRRFGKSLMISTLKAMFQGRKDVFELKVDKPPKVAMSQIQRKKYASPCRAASKPVWAVGLSFEGKTRQFAGGVAEAVK